MYCFEGSIFVAGSAIQWLRDKLFFFKDSKETELALKPFKVKTVMTSDNHISGTDRIEEVSREIEVDIIVNIQGDEPMIDPRLIDTLVNDCLLYTSPSPRDGLLSRMPSSA